jgi:subtilisin family serine protease
MWRYTLAAGRLALVATSLCVLANPCQAQNPSWTAPIDPAVIAEFDAHGETTFWVLFRERADLEPAFAIRDWGERGRFVYHRLVATANSSQAGVRALLSALDAQTRAFWIANTIEVTAASSAVPGLLAARPEVAAIVAPPAVELIEGSTGMEGPPTQPVEWNIAQVRAPLVWSRYGVRGEGIVIGSIDSGVQYDHPALVEQYRGNLGGGVFDHNYSWYDPASTCGSPPSEPCDSYWHGTATTGVAVGDDGGSNRIGVAPGARFIMAAVNWSNSSLLAAMEWMLAPTDLAGHSPRPDLRPHVVSNSWVTAGGTTLFQSAVQAWLAAGIFPVFAAGNSGPGCQTILSPADYPESYAVGASCMDCAIASFSSRGPSVFGTMKPDLTAPGASVRSCVPWGSYEAGLWGTSFAAPHVTGTVALMLSLNPELIGNTELIRRHLDHSAIDVADLNCGGDPGDNTVWGEGRLDAFAAASLTLVDSFESGDLSAWSAVTP